MSGTVIRDVKKDEIFTVEIEENASTGYLWKFVEKDNVEVRGISTKPLRDDEVVLVGGAHIKIFFMQIKEVGEYELVFTLQRPWEGTVVRHHHEHFSVSKDR